MESVRCPPHWRSPEGRARSKPGTHLELATDLQSPGRPARRDGEGAKPADRGFGVITWGPGPTGSPPNGHHPQKAPPTLGTPRRLTSILAESGGANLCYPARPSGRWVGRGSGFTGAGGVRGEGGCLPPDCAPLPRSPPGRSLGSLLPARPWACAPLGPGVPGGRAQEVPGGERSRGEGSGRPAAPPPPRPPPRPPPGRDN